MNNNELQEIERRCRLLLDFHESAADNEITRVFMAQFRQAVDQAVEKGDRRNLRMACRDLEGLADELPPDKRNELKRLLATEGLSSIELSRIEESSLVSEIIKRGEIRSPDEHALLRGWYENRESVLDPELELEVERLLASHEAAEG